jgi:A/G-specific adenine glycosylase
MNSSFFNGFVNGILPWYLNNQRDLPWRNTRDPYAIWLSEVILQQTRVQQGLSYYHAFLSAYPDVLSLSAASEDEVFKIWQGLGYYSRARNLMRTAQCIVQEMDGQFPQTFEGLLKLPGVGPYTAAAIASFAFDVPKAAVDGNVLRWTSRLFGSDAPIDLPATKAMVQTELDRWIGQTSPHLFNQAAMEFGAMLCSPVPKCGECPLNEQCIAFREQKVKELPVKSKKVKVEEKHVYAFFFHNAKGNFAVEKLPEKGIWAGLYSLPMWMSDEPLNQADVLKRIQKQGWVTADVCDLPSPYLVTHLLTHRRLKVHIFCILLKNMPKNASIFERWISAEEARHLGFPKVFERYLKTQIPKYAGLI